MPNGVHAPAPVHALINRGLTEERCMSNVNSFVGVLANLIKLIDAQLVRMGSSSHVRVLRSDSLPAGAAAVSHMDARDPWIKIPSDRVLSQLPDDVRRRVLALVLHELLHVLETLCSPGDMKQVMKLEESIGQETGVGADKVHELHNVFEDGRIERTSYSWRPGFELDFHDLILGFWQKGDMVYHALPANSPAPVLDRLELFALLYIRCKYHAVDEMRPDVFAARADLVQLTSEQAVSQVESIIDTAVMTGSFNDGKNFENQKLTLELVRQALLAVGLKADPNQQSQSQDDQQSDSDDGQGEGEPQDSDQSESDRQSQSGQRQQSKPQSKGSDPKGGESKGGESKGMGKPSDEEQDDADHLRASASAKATDLSKTDNLGQSCAESAKDMAREMSKAQAQAIADERKNGGMDKAEASRMLRMLGKVILSPAADSNLLDGADYDTPHVRGAQQLRARLVGDCLRKTVFEKGVLDPRRLTKAYTAGMLGKTQADVYKKFTVKHDHGHDVDIVIDASGSMVGSSQYLAAKAAWCTWHAVFGLPDTTVRVTEFGGGSEHDVRELIPVRRSASFKEMSRRYEIIGSTPTHLGVLESTKSLLSRPGMNKLMLVVTDGSPDELDWTRQSLVSARKAGIEVVTIFIGGCGFNIPQFKDVCKCVDVPNEEELQQRMLEEIARVISK